MSQVAFSHTLKVSKLDDEQRIVWAWANQITDTEGKPVVDTQGDVIDAVTLEKALTSFMLESGAAGEMHERTGIGRVCAAFPVTKQLREAFGLGDSKVEGAIVGIKVDDDAVWKRIKSGELPELSIGGSAKRVAA